MMTQTLRILAACSVSIFALTGVASAQERAPRPGAPVAQVDPFAEPPPELQGGAVRGGVQQPARAPAAGGYDVFVDDGRAQRARTQAQGEYPTMERTTGGVPLGSIQDAWNNPTRNMPQGQVAPGTVRFNWSTDLIMPVRIRDNMVTKLILPDWEEVVEVISGEDVYMQSIKLQTNIVGIRSMASGIDTTVDVVGASGNVYSFYVRAESWNTRRLTDINVFVMAAPSMKGTMSRRGQMMPNFSAFGERPFAPGHLSAEAQQQGRTTLASQPTGGPAAPARPGQGPDFGAVSAPIPEQMKFDMRMFEVSPGDREMAPELVYTDAGGWTYFDFGDKANMIERPVVFKIVDGVETRVNTRTIGTRGQILVAETVGDFVLRAGTKTVCVRRTPPAAAAR